MPRKMIAEHGYTILTGLAQGCDAVTVKGALSVDGKVIGAVQRGLKSLQLTFLMKKSPKKIAFSVK